MQTATREETQSIKRFILFVFLPLVICIIFVLGIIGKNQRIQEKIDDVEKVMQHAIRKYDAVPTFKYLSSKKNTYKTLQDNFHNLTDISTLVPISPPDDVVERGVYFKKQLFMTYKKLNATANDAGILFPETLGFSEALPSFEEVALLLRKLETLKAVVDELIKSQVTSITLIKLLDDNDLEKYKAENKSLTEISFRIDMEMTPKTLSKVLFKITNLQPYVSVRDINVKKIKDNLLEVSIVVSRFIVEKEK